MNFSVSDKFFLIFLLNYKSLISSGLCFYSATGGDNFNPIKREQFSSPGGDNSEFSSSDQSDVRSPAVGMKVIKVQFTIGDWDFTDNK